MTEPRLHSVLDMAFDNMRLTGYYQGLNKAIDILHALGCESASHLSKHKEVFLKNHPQVIHLTQSDLEFV